MRFTVVQRQGYQWPIGGPKAAVLAYVNGCVCTFFTETRVPYILKFKRTPSFADQLFLTIGKLSQEQGELCHANPKSIIGTEGSLQFDCKGKYAHNRSTTAYIW